jgi:flagellar biosynthesis/type III secretory pathway protein FliH
MAERGARTIGAQKAAEAAQAAAAEKVRQYEEALRQARAKVYAEQEADRRKLMEGRAAMLKDARSKADAEVNASKERVAGEFAGAKEEIEGVTPQLAAEIARRVLHAPPAPGTPTRESR